MIPLELRQSLAHVRRQRIDRSKGITFHGLRGGEEWPIRIALSQPILPSPVLDAKMMNLKRGADLVDRSLIHGLGAHDRNASTWSFWNTIGKPKARNGFARGRNIVEGTVVRQIGGGLCQLSSLFYHMSLLGGLDIIERHHHSIDLYSEEERFTPLGADATVVWGFKDLRLANPYPFAVCLGCTVENDRLIGYIRSPEVIEAKELAFTREALSGNSIRVTTSIDAVPSVESLYHRQVR